LADEAFLVKVQPVTVGVDLVAVDRLKANQRTHTGQVTTAFDGGDGLLGGINQKTRHDQTPALQEKTAA
jgi:hypothetical protein